MEINASFQLLIQRIQRTYISILQNLTQSIKGDITKLNNQLKILQSVTKGRSSSKQATEHTNNVIMSLQTKLADTSLGFKDVLELEVSKIYIHKRKLAKEELMNFTRWAVKIPLIHQINNLHHLNYADESTTHTIIIQHTMKKRHHNLWVFPWLHSNNSNNNRWCK